ncbi:hypothetical protein B0H14DRAFT_2742317 [Mycena olivaceomarginata]|nr:hypothetical protein B0H14DRAFT_2742317 [Mycena olivaceomarginata]
MRLSTSSLVLLALWAAKLGRGQKEGKHEGGKNNQPLPTNFCLALDPGSQVTSSTTSISSDPGPPNGASPSFFVDSSSGSAPFSQTTSIPRTTDSTQATSAPEAGPTHRAKSRIHAGGIAAIAVVLSILLFCLAAILVWHIRRRRRQRQAAKSSEMRIDRAATTISPFTLITEASTPPQQERNAERRRLETQLHAATEKIADIEGRERFDGGDGSADSGMRRLMSARSASTRLPEVEAQLQAAREQIDMLVTRINALEENSDAGWGRVIGDEPPPEYV